MPHDRFYIDAQFEQDKQLELEGSELHHMVRVSRLRVGETVELINGRGYLATAEVTALERNLAILTILSLVQQERSPPQLILAQALLKPNLLDWVVEKGTELGVTDFWLFPGHQSERNDLSSNQLQRVHHLILSATKQCGRLDLPRVELKPELLKWQALAATAFFGDLSPSAPNFLQVSPSPIAPLLLFIGPESGFDKQEIAHLKQMGALGVRLHHHTLRAETAALAGLVLANSLLNKS